MGIEHIRKAYKELVRRRHRFWLSLSERGQKTFILGGSVLLTCGFFFQIIKQMMNPLGNIPKDEKHLYNNDNYFRGKLTHSIAPNLSSLLSLMTIYHFMYD